jgi:hypothetical protein
LTRGLGVAVLLGLLAGCTNFPVVQDDQCGNAVLEEGEDCDTFVNGNEGAVCRPSGRGACRYDCTEQQDGTRAKCPKEMGCSLDGICRPATYDFEEPKILSSDLSSYVTALDFDGDGSQEVVSAEPSDQLQQARFRLHYFDRDSRLAETRAFPRPTGRPVVRKLEGQGTEDLAFTNFQIGMVPGRKDRAFVPSTFSSYIVDNGDLRTVNVSEGTVNQSLALVAISTAAGKTGEDETGVYIPAEDSSLTFNRSLPGPVSELVSEPLTADLVTTADSPCAEVVLAYRGKPSAQILDVCELGTNPLFADVVWRGEFREQNVSLPGGRGIDSRPVAADVNGDGHLDLLLGSAGETFVALGDGHVLEERASRLDIPIQDELGGTILTLPTPVAAGDITGDGVADYVLPNAILGSHPSLIDGTTVYAQSYTNTSLPWTTASVGDLNGNQLTDVIAATEGEPGLWFVSGSGGAIPVVQPIPTRGDVRFIATGDFDGNGIGDVAYIEDQADFGADALSVAYGTRDNAPLPGVQVAEVTGVQQLGRERDAGLDSIFTTSTDELDGVRRGKFTLFAGDASGLPFAPFFLVEFATPGDMLEGHLSPALITGSFVRPGQGDAISLGMDNVLSDRWSQWLLQDISSGNERPRLLAEDAPNTDAFVFTFEGTTSIRLSAAGVASDLNGDGLDEAVWVMPEGSNDGRGGCTLLISNVDPESLDRKKSDRSRNLDERPALVRRQRLSFPESCPSPEIRAADLDKDSRPELLLLIGDPERGARQVQLLWNDGEGAFSLNERSFIAAPDSQDISSFALFPRPPRSSAREDDSVPDYGVRLAFVTPTTLLTAEPRRDVREWVIRRSQGEFRDARSVVVADTNGDHFLEAVVADARGLWMLAAGLKADDVE